MIRKALRAIATLVVLGMPGGGVVMLVLGYRAMRGQVAPHAFEPSAIAATIFAQAVQLASTCDLDDPDQVRELGRCLQNAHTVLHS